ncbi:MAG TPA: RHS repeat-associated core domain-containing protein, partial [Bryobacteraceae bacterium]|nr:RHS repeat-associated core domain-containing protein [Bryobacteraceae bacterium]
AGPRQRFTGKERDIELATSAMPSGLDYFGARYYGPVLGRFTSADEFPGGIVDPLTGQQIGQPGPLPYADITDPQTLNKYAYVRNNPLRYTDPDGHCIWDLCIGEGAAVYAAGAATVTAAAYLMTPQGKESARAAIAGLGLLINNAADGIRDLVAPPPSTPTDAQIQTSQDASTLQPGPHAGDSIPARGPQRDFTPGERGQVNDIGTKTGCHTCGTTTPGTKGGNFVPDHQPPSAVNTNNAPQRLIPNA